PVPREGHVDGHHAVHLPGLLPDPAVRHHVVGLCRPHVLDARHHGLQSGHSDGDGHHSHRHVWHDHAAACGRQRDRGRLLAQGGPRSVLRRSETVRYDHRIRPSHRLCLVRRVWRPQGYWCRHLARPDYPALLCGPPDDAARRGAPEGLR
ncbi:hypothetical protein HK405_000102, partial [Cladochytrium tenue]